MYTNKTNQPPLYPKTILNLPHEIILLIAEYAGMWSDLDCDI